MSLIWVVGQIVSLAALGALLEGDWQVLFFTSDPEYRLYRGNIRLNLIMNGGDVYGGSTNVNITEIFSYPLAYRIPQCIGVHTLYLVTFILVTAATVSIVLIHMGMQGFYPKRWYVNIRAVLCMVCGAGLIYWQTHCPTEIIIPAVSDLALYMSEISTELILSGVGLATMVVQLHL